MKTFVQKMTSRKFLAAAVGVIAGLAMVFGLDDGIISTVTGAVTAAASVISYITTEGKIDAASVRSAVNAVEDVRKELADGAD